MWLTFAGKFLVWSATIVVLHQCECGTPVPQRPQALGLPEHAGPSSAPLEVEANTESFFCSLVEPHFGQCVPRQSVERTSTSLSLSQSAQ
jgi:hypothetical protein